MNIKLDFQQLKNPSIVLVATILILPILPFWHYYNLSFLILNLTILVFVIMRTHLFENKIQLSDFGVIGLLLMILFSNLIHGNSPPIATNYLVYLLLGLTYFSLVLLTKPEVFIKILKNLLVLFFIGTSLFIYFIAFQKQFNYAQLTSKFSYQNGLGNISQLSMYICFYLIGIFYTHKNKWLLSVVSLLSLGLATILQSKLIFLILLLMLISKALSRYSFKINIYSFSILMGSAITYLSLNPPSSLKGRIELFKLSWTNYDFSKFLGVGPGTFNSFINKGFINEETINKVGHIDHLAFNDFSQIFVELGFPGLISLLLIFIGLINKKNLFYLVAIACILFFMFPLQYLESGILFILIISLFRLNNEAKKFSFSYPKKYVKVISISFSLLVLFYNVTDMNVLKKWAKLDQSLTIEKDKSSNLRLYKDLESDLFNNDEYYLSFGMHLLKNKNYNEALKAFNKAKKINPSYKSFIYIGDCYFELGHYREAISSYDISKRIRPKHLYPVYKSIYALRNIGKEKEAIDYWVSVKDSYPKMYSPKMLTMKQEIESLLK